jgi:hypothetical protein
MSACTTAHLEPAIEASQAEMLASLRSEAEVDEGTAVVGVGH